MIKSIVGISCLLVGGVVLFANSAAHFEQEPETTQSKTDGFMKQKLKHTTAIVEGLATDDLKEIADGAEALMLLSQEADWNAIKTPAYLKMSNEFRSSAKRLRRSAEEKNLDGATLAFFEVTLNCVRCHKYVRSQR